MTQAMVLGGLRRCEVLGLRLGDLRLGEWRVLIREGKGGHERLIPLSPTFFATVARYMDHERPETSSDALFVALKGARRGQPLSMPGLQQIIRPPGCAPVSATAPATSCATPASPVCAKPAWPSKPSRPWPDTARSPRPGSISTSASTGSPTSTAGPPKPSRPRRWWGWPDQRARTCTAAEPRRRGGGTPEVTWSQIAARAPVMVATMASYLDQLEVSARPGTVAAAELTLRFFAHRVSEADPACVSVARIDDPTSRTSRPGSSRVEATPASPWPP